jgi:hypothetical protein
VAAPANARVCCEHESVAVAWPGLVSTDHTHDRRRPDAVHRLGRPPRLLRGRDRGRDGHSFGGQGGDDARVAWLVCRESGARRPGRARGDRQRAGDRRDPARARRVGGARQPAGGARRERQGPEDRQDRRSLAGAAVGDRVSARGVGAGRRDRGDPQPARASAPAGQAAHPREEPRPRGATTSTRCCSETSSPGRR